MFDCDWSISYGLNLKILWRIPLAPGGSRLDTVQHSATSLHHQSY